jgi:hypothetical protein
MYILVWGTFTSQNWATCLTNPSVYYPNNIFMLSHPKLSYISEVHHPNNTKTELHI